MTSSIRGFTDLFDAKTLEKWHWLENKLIQIARSHAYEEIRLPFMEHTELFQRAIGATSDIVHKEMYTFTDKNGKSVTLRPEGTASCIRACHEHQLLYHNSKKFYYLSPMFRRERPQKGRLRQFHQFGLEALNIEGPIVDVEHLQLLNTLWQSCNVKAKLHIHYLGGKETRSRYKSTLTTYYSPYYEQFSPIEQERYRNNPLRLLDSKTPFIQATNQNAPKLIDELSDQEHQSFKHITSTLTHLEIPFHIDHTLVRGLDYYTGLIYEWIAEGLGAQSTLCGGGRYDGLYQQLYGKHHPSTGFSIGLERLLSLIPDELCNTPEKLKIAWVSGPETAPHKSIHTLKILRENFPSTQFDGLYASSLNPTTLLKRLVQEHYRAVVFYDDANKPDEVRVKILNGSKIDTWHSIHSLPKLFQTLSF